MRIIAWCFVLASAPFFIYYGYWFIQPSLVDSDIRAIKLIEHDVVKSLNQIDLEFLLTETNGCDEFLLIDRDSPLLGSIIPPREKGFFIKLCEPTSINFTGQLGYGETDAIAIVGVTPLRDDLTNTPSSKSLIRYEITNGTYSRGDLIFPISKNNQGILHGPKQRIFTAKEFDQGE